MVKRYLLLSLCLLMLVGLAAAQEQQIAEEASAHKRKIQQKIDSIKQLSFTDIRTEIKATNELIRCYRDFELDSAIAYSLKGMALAESLKDQTVLASSRINHSSLLYQQDSLDQALAVLLQNRKHYDQINEDKRAHTEAALSNLFIATERFDEALKSALESAEMFERLQDSSQAGYSYISVAEVEMLVLKDLEGSLEHLNRAVMLLRAQKSNKEYLIAALSARGDVHSRMKNYEAALDNYLQAEKACITYQSFWYYPDILTNLGQAYFQFGKHGQSIEYLEKALDESGGESYRLAKIFSYLAKNYKDLGLPRQALNYYEIALQFEKRLAVRIDYKKAMAECLVELNDFEQAYSIQEELFVLKDSLNNQQREEKVTAVIEQYENEKKQLQIEQLDAENKEQESLIDQQYGVIWSLLALFGALGFGGFAWIRVRQKLREERMKVTTMQLQQRFLRVQLNPHFLFHALSSIEGYIYGKDIKAAASFLQNFSRLMRNILESSDRDFIPLSTDIELIREYIILQQLNSEFRFDYTLEVAENLNTEALQVPPMLFQPFVENAILHGALNAENGNIKLHYFSKNNHLHVRIQDNGPGPDFTSRKKKSLLRSMGIDIVQQRIQNLKEIHGIVIRYTVSSGEEGQVGTVVEFVLPQPLIDRKSNAS